MKNTLKTTNFPQNQPDKMPLTSCGSKVYSNDAEMCKRGNRNGLSGQTTWNSIKTMKNHVDQPEQAWL